MNEKPLPLTYRVYPFGIVRHDQRIALDRDGAVILLSGRVTAVDGETYLPHLLEYALEEPLPRVLILGGVLILEALETQSPIGDARRRLLFSGPDGTPQELWAYLEGAGLWIAVSDTAWIATFLAKSKA